MNLQIKQVNFNNDTLLAAKDLDANKIYVALRFICSGLGLTEGQTHHQTTKAISDMVLQKGVRKIILPTNGGNQEAICLELDYIPLWLAKMNANIVKDTVIQNKLIQYQLKAKDVLAQAFLEQQSPLCVEDLIILHATALKDMRLRMEALENKVNSISNRLSAPNDVNIIGDQRQQLNNMIRKFAQDKGIPYEDAWRMYRVAYNTAYRTNIKRVATSYAKRNDLKKVTVPEVLVALNKIGDGLKVAEKLIQM